MAALGRVPTVQINRDLSQKISYHSLIALVPI